MVMTAAMTVGALGCGGRAVVTMTAVIAAVGALGYTATCPVKREPRQWEDGEDFP